MPPKAYAPSRRSSFFSFDRCVPMQADCKYVYVMGRGHSGSTVLDALLGNANDARGIGEVVAGIDGTHPCSCGASVDECLYWQEVRRQFGKCSDFSWKQMVNRIAGEAHIFNFARVLAASESSQFVRETRRSIRDVAQSIRDVSAASCIVDSSKELSRGLFLARFLPEARVIHLVRNPRRMLASNLHRLRDGTGFVFLRHRFQSRTLAPLILGLSALSWTVGNLLCELTSRLAPSRVLRVRYEDLCANPAQELRRISAFTELNLTSVIDAIEDRESLPIQHKLAGNRMAKQGEFIFEPERSEARSLPNSIQWIGQALTWPLACLYDYA